MDIDTDSASAVADSVASTGGSALPVVGDVANPDDIDRVVKASMKEFGRIDVLINNAGINLRRQSLFDLTLEDWNRIIKVNQTGVFLATKAVAEVMRDQRAGSIINIASTVAQIAIPNIAAYTTTKGAISAWTRASAVELAPFNVRVNAIAPGFVETEMSAQWQRSPELATQYAAMVAKIPLGRVAKPDELNGVVVFLSSPASQYLTGTTIFVDGGYVIQ